MKTSNGTKWQVLKVRVVTPLKFKENKKLLQMNETSQIELETSSNEAEISWSSSDKKVATVDQNGNVTAVSPGTTKIRVNQIIYSSDKHENYAILSDECEVTVQDPGQGWISAELDHETFQILGPSLYNRLTLIETSEEGKKRETIEKVTWESTNRKVATVDQNGMITPVKRRFYLHNSNNRKIWYKKLLGICMCTKNTK